MCSELHSTLSFRNDCGSPFEFPIGMKRLIASWDGGVAESQPVFLGEVGL